MPTDLPGQSPLLTTLPHAQVDQLRELCSRDLLFFAEVCMGYEDLVERFHRPVCDFLEHNPSRFKLVMLARSTLKTSLCTIARTAKNALVHPNRRYLMLNEVEGRAQEWLLTIRTVYEENAILRTLYSDVIPKQAKDATHWSSEKLTLNRTVNVATPTIRAAGMTTSLTGDHYTDITVDDPISEKAREEPSTMEKAISRISKMTSFFVEPSIDRYTLVGTPWAKHDVIASFRRNYGRKLATYFMPAVLNDELTLPERLTWEVLQQAQIDLGDLQYSAQYLLVPRDSATSDFLPTDLREWVWADPSETVVALLNADRQIIRECRLEMLDLTMTVDLAIAEHDQADRSAITVCGTTDDGVVIVLDTWAERTSPGGLIDAIFQKYVQWGPRVIGIESVGYQKSLKYFLRAESEQRGLYLPVRDLPALGKKMVRIRGMQPIAASGRLYLHARQQRLRQELLDFPDPSSHDDLADALAMHLALFQGVLAQANVQRDAMTTAEILRKIRGYGTITQDEADDLDDDRDWDVPLMSALAPRTAA